MWTRHSAKSPGKLDAPSNEPQWSSRNRSLRLRPGMCLLWSLNFWPELLTTPVPAPSTLFYQCATSDSCSWTSVGKSCRTLKLIEPVIALNITSLFLLHAWVPSLAFQARSCSVALALSGWWDVHPQVRAVAVAS